MRRIRRKQRGSALLTTTVLVTMILSFLLAGMAMVTLKSTEAFAASTQLQARTVAEAGVEHGIFWLREVMKIWGSFDVFDNLDPNQTEDIDTGATQVIFSTPETGQLPGDLADAANISVGQYDVFFDVRDRASADFRTIVIRSQSYVPTKAAYLSGDKHAASTTVFTKIRLSQQDGQPGNYSYFINNWGWFYGSSITSEGSVRANGKFTLRYNPTINGSPIYGEAKGADLSEPLNDGGIFAGLNVDGTCRGMAGAPDNQYEHEDPLLMPNLSNLAWYKDKAVKQGSSISVGGKEWTGNGVYGDGPGERDHLYLVGTADDPIKIKGTVVVDGSVVVKGYVSGQGTIIAGGNLYIADDIHYLNPPATRRPSGTGEEAVEAWIEDNLDKDFVGFYAREHIVVGDYTNTTWQNYVFGWLLNSNNRSDEDAGMDRVHNTKDESENDGTWIVEEFTNEHQALGLIPQGGRIGDVIPGTGEDIDGDGTEDRRLNSKGNWLNAMNLPQSLSSSHWGGNLPKNGTQYRDVSTINIGNLDGCFYTNHAFGAYMRDSKMIRINGALICRNESIVFSPRIEMNHDERLTGRSWEDLGLIGGGGKVWESITVEAWWTGSGGQ